MRLADVAGLTDAGRKRRRNEDAFVLEPPLFAVADGMGGAQAGEVASRLAAAVLLEFHEAGALAPEERIAATIREANRRIYERAQADTLASGMGTTITAALVEGEQVSIGHVGDSRAYLIRDGSLEQLTQDHSLVADLMRSGRLTQEEAEVHPQRSVITRALGTDPEVEVDTVSIDARAGDVFLLCTDGLTTMVEDEQIVQLVTASPDLAEAARALLRAANRSGGEDNVTAVLFRLESGEAALEATAESRGEATDQDLEDTLTGLEVPAALREPPPAEQTRVVRPEELPGWPEPPPRRPVVTAPPPPPPAPASPPRRKREGRWGRRFFWSFAALAFVLVVIAAAFWGLSRANFVGANEDGRLTVYQGLPWELGAGVNLFRARYVSQVQTVQLSPAERAELFDHSLLSYAEARARIRQYEEEALPSR